MEPFETVVARCDRAVSPRRPDPADERLQPDAVRVGGAGSEGGPVDRLGVAFGLLGDDFGALFLNAACSSGLAAPTCRSRGREMVQPRARRASRPRYGATEASSGSLAMTAATFFAVQTPPSAGGVLTRARSIARTSGVRRAGLAPLPQRRSPRLGGPKRLYRATSSSTEAAGRSRSAAPPPRNPAPPPAARSPDSAAPAPRPRSRASPPEARRRSDDPQPAPCLPPSVSLGRTAKLSILRGNPRHRAAISRKPYQPACSARPFSRAGWPGPGSGRTVPGRCAARSPAPRSPAPDRPAQWRSCGR